MNSPSSRRADKPSPSPSKTATDEGVEADTDTVAKNTAVVAVLTLLSRLTGFGRVVAIAAVLGVNRLSDLYQSLNLLPNYTHELLTGSLITALLVPPLVRHLDGGDQAAMRRIAGGFLTLVVGFAIGVVLVIVGAGFLVVRAFTFGVNDAAEAAELMRLGWPLLALLMPQVIFYGVAATGAAAQNASGRFALAAGAPVVENLMIIAVLGIWAGRFGTGIESIAGVGTDQIVFLGLGTTAAVMAHAALQWFGAARCGIVLMPRMGWRDAEVRQIVRLALPSAGYAALNAGRLVALLLAAGLVTGGQTLFLVALNFFNLPVALTSKPLTTAIMPVLARLRESATEFGASYRRGLGVLLLVAAPSAAVMAGLAKPLATMGLWGDAADARSVSLLAAGLAAVALAVPGESVFIFSTSAAYAKLDARSPFRAMTLRLVVSVVAIVTVVVALRADVIDDWQVLVGLGLAMALADTIAAGYLARAVTDRSGGLLAIARPLIGVGFAVLLVAGGTAVLAEELFGSSRVVAAATLIIGGLISLAVLAGLTVARGGAELRDFVSAGSADGGASGTEAPASPALPELSVQPTAHRVQRSTLVLASAFGVLFVVGLIASAAIAYAGALAPAIPLGIAGLLLIGIVAWKPSWGPLFLLGTTPLVVGLLRGSFVPFLRVSEALLFAVAAGTAVRVLYDLFRGRSSRLASAVDRLDWAIGALILTGSILPLVLRFGRGLELTIDDLTQAFILAKFGLLYFVVRIAIRTRVDVRRALKVSLLASAPVAFLALAQSMQVPGVAATLRPWLDQPADVYIGRGAGTIGNSIALGDVMAVHLAMAMMLFFRRRETGTYESRSGRRRALMSGMSVLPALAFLLGALGSGQFSGFAAAGVAVVVAAVVGRQTRLLLATPAVGAVVCVGLWPVISRRFESFGTGSGLPQSWQARIDNLNEFFLPELARDFNWVLGVRPKTGVENPDEIIGTTFIESGFVWLLWVGGAALLVAFVVLMGTALRRFLVASRATDPWLSAVGGAGLAATAFIVLLTITDPHLTMRGIADVYFPLLAMALVAANESETAINTNTRGSGV